MAMSMAGPRGKAAYALKQNAEINVTPFVDVMLVLLIVMMVTAPLATVAVNLDMPPATRTASAPPTVLSVTDEGLFLTTGAAARPTTLAALPADLGRALGAASAHPRVMLRADRHVRYGRFMQVVNTMKASGYDRIGLINEALK
ncbi:biopolymer transporter ExbD [Caulobacter sp. KR2-114]|uniref:biopolymer transporter ExbD n=1 Tax=Caulobacter sp. KR2-114 TaxID=3400912 RepID=UPI003C105BF4